MSNDVLKGLIVSLGFKLDGESYKKQTEAIKKMEKNINSLDAADRSFLKDEKKRIEERKQHYEALGLAMGTFAAAAVAAAGLAAAAVAKMLGNFDQLYYVSGRTGASVNNLKALGNAFAQTGSSAERAMGMLESFAKARRMNPGVDAMLKNYGVNTKGDSADVLGNAIDSISAKHPYFAGSQIAGLLGISEEDFEHFTRYRKEIAHFNADYKALQKSLGVDGNKTATAANQIARAFGSLHATVEVLGDKLTQVLAPVVERMVKGFQAWLASNPERIDTILRKIADALEGVGKWLSKDETWDSFAKFWDKLYTGIDRVVTVVQSLLDLFFKLSNLFNSGPVKKYLNFMFGGGLLGGSIFGTSAQAAEVGEGGGHGSASANDNGGSKPGLIRRGWNAVKRGLGIESAGNNVDRAPLGPVPQGLLDNIARAEGTYRTGYNTSLAHGRYLPGGKEHDLTNKSLNEIITLGNHMRRQPGNPNSSALGRYQIVGTTLRAAAKALGMDMETTKFNEATQDQMAHWIARKQGLGAWEGFKGHPAERAAAASALARRDDSAGARPQMKIVVPQASAGSFVGRGFNPGSFDVNAYLRSAPLGATSTTNNQSSMNVNSPTNVTINGVTDPQKAADHFERAANRSNDLMLRNVQAAAR